AAADDQGMVAQLWIVALFDRSIEGVAIHMGDGKAVELGVRQHTRRPASGATLPCRKGGQTIAAKGGHDGVKIALPPGAGKGFASAPHWPDLSQGQVIRFPPGALACMAPVKA